MAQVNTCLKRTFTVFNVLFAIIGALLITLAFQHQVFTNFRGGENMQAGIYGIYIVGAVTMVIAILGAYGAHRESKLCLSVFLGCMVTGTLLMLLYGIPAAISRPKIEEKLEQDMHFFVPLDTAPEEIRSSVDTLQAEMHCCGLFSYTDWGDNIPDSCNCSPTEENMCTPVGYSDLFVQRRFVYSKTCFSFIIDNFRLIIDVAMGILFTLASLALLGTILSSIMIHQMRCSTGPTIVLKIPTTFVSPSPPKYQQFQDEPPAYC